MPSVSKKQHNLMAAVAKNPRFAKKVGIPQNVGEDFLQADKGKQFLKGGQMKKAKKMAGGGMPDQSNKGGAARGLERAAAVSGRDFSDMGRPTTAGKPAGMKKGGACKKMADGGPTAFKNVPALPTSASGTARDKMTYRPATPMKKGGKVKCMADGGTTTTVATPAPTQPMPKATLPSQANIPTLPSQASDRAKAIMAARLAARTPATTTPAKMARGGGVETKGKTRGTMVKMARGGGVEVKGKTRGKMV